MMIGTTTSLENGTGRALARFPSARGTHLGRPIAVLLLVALPLAGCGRPALYCGHTVSMDDRDTVLSALVERGGGLFAGRLDGVQVDFHAGDVELGQGQTDKLGFAVVTGRIPPGIRTIEARAQLDGHNLRSEGTVYPWVAGRTIVVCDIDGTVSQTDVHALLFDRSDTESRPLPDAAETLQHLAEHYNLFFLTGRPIAWHAKTYEWLEAHGFPAVPAVLAPDVRIALKVEHYKAHFIKLLRELYPNVLIGIGNAETDSQAYTASGLLPLMIDDGKKRRFRSEALPMRSWKQVRRFFDANHDVLTDPPRLRSLLETGGLLQYPQPPLKGEGR
jgi:hypothetical protein